MGYPKDLDQYTDALLIGELELRREDRNEGKCDYCHRPYTDPVCRYPDRHARAGEQFYKDWKADYNVNWIIAYNGNYVLNISKASGHGSLFHRKEDGYSEEVSRRPFDKTLTERKLFEVVVDWSEGHIKDRGD